MTLGFTDMTAANVQAAPERMIGSLGSLGALNPTQRFPGIRCPALLVHSELDPLPTEWSRALVDMIPDADFLIDGGSHFPMIEDSDQLRSAVVAWLRKHSN